MKILLSRDVVNRILKSGSQIQECRTGSCAILISVRFSSRSLPRKCVVGGGRQCVHRQELQLFDHKEQHFVVKNATRSALQRASELLDELQMFTHILVCENMTALLLIKKQ